MIVRLLTNGSDSRIECITFTVVDNSLSWGICVNFSITSTTKNKYHTRILII